jgi:hypothetical protein
MYSPTRYASLRVDSAPSLLFCNLACSAEVIAFASGGTAHVLPHSALADVSVRGASFRLALGAHAPPPPPLAPPAVSAGTIAAPAPAEAPAAAAHSTLPDAVTALAVAQLQAAGPLLLAATPSALHVYACSEFSESATAAPRALFTRSLADLGPAVLGARRAEEHYFRGLAGAPLANALLAGTSWGDVLAWRVEGAVLTLAAVLSGGHAAAITSIAADDRRVCARAGCRGVGRRSFYLTPSSSLRLSLLRSPPSGARAGSSSLGTTRGWCASGAH